MPFDLDLNDSPYTRYPMTNTEEPNDTPKSEEPPPTPGPQCGDGAACGDSECGDSKEAE
jgi:hypothetical protein